MMPTGGASIADLQGPRAVAFWVRWAGLVLLLLGVVDVAHWMLSQGMIGLALVTRLGPLAFYGGLALGVAIAATVPLIGSWVLRSVVGWWRANSGAPGFMVTHGTGWMRTAAHFAAGVHVAGSLVALVITVGLWGDGFSAAFMVRAAVAVVTCAAMVWVSIYYASARCWNVSDGARWRASSLARP